MTRFLALGWQKLAVELFFVSPFLSYPYILHMVGAG